MRRYSKYAVLLLTVVWLAGRSGARRGPERGAVDEP